MDRPVPQRAVVLASAHSGAAAVRDDALRALTESGVVVDEVIPVEEAERLAAQLTVDGAAPLVVAAGGDGTVSAAVNAIAGTQALLAILPLGTSNDVARSLGIPTDPVRAARMIADGRVCQVDAGSIRTHGRPARLFLNAATVGLNVAFARIATQPSLRERFGRFTYLVAMPSALREQRPFECTLEYDGVRRSLTAVEVAISNAPAFGGVLGMRVPGATMTDGLLDVIAVEPLTRPRRALAVGRAAIGRPRLPRGVHTARVRTLTITAPDRQEVTIDGEIFGELPATLEVRPNAVQVVVPAA